MRKLPSLDLVSKTEEEYRLFKLMLKAQLRHTKWRLRHRYGIKINEFDYYEMINMIVSGDSVLINKNVSVEFHFIYFKDTNVLTVYDPNTQTIRTVLSSDTY